VQFDRHRLPIVVGALIIALLVMLFPPWLARAIRTTTRYAAVPGVVPVTVIDTVVWSLSFEPLYAPPRPALDAERMRTLATRSFKGDTSARAELRRETGAFEQRFGAPEVLRTTGELWRDSVLAVAGIPSLSSYSVTFALDDRRLAMRLAAIAAIALLLDYRRRGLLSTRPPRPADRSIPQRSTRITDS